jgi:hypothetical protein
MKLMPDRGIASMATPSSIGSEVKVLDRQNFLYIAA